MPVRSIFQTNDNTKPMFRQASQSGYVVNDSYRMLWYSVEGKTNEQMGHIDVQIIIDDTSATTISNFYLNGLEQTWTDYSVANKNDLTPRLHRSFSPQRDLSLNFGKQIQGSYFDKGNNQTSDISLTIKKEYFDSTLYPHLVRWSDLKAGKTISFLLFNHNSGSKGDVTVAKLFDILDIDYEINNEIVKSWSVKSTNGITNHKAITTFIIEKNSRKILRMDIENEGRKSYMVRV